MLSKDEAFKLTRFKFDDLKASAAAIRDAHVGDRITYTPQVALPLTQLCRDSCGYCTFAQSPTTEKPPYLELDKIGDLCRNAEVAFCSEAFFTLGEFPEEKYDEAKQWLESHGYQTTIDYLAAASKYVLENFGLLPTTNPGSVTGKTIAKLKQSSSSQKMLLENIAGRLSEPGGPHFGCPDKAPARRLSSLEAAGREKVPFSTGVLIGIGETREEIISTLLAIRELHTRFNHIQEVIVSNFLPRPNTSMENAQACDEYEHLWAIAATRLIFNDTTHVQAAPNITHSVLNLIDAGIDDLGGISPVTPDYHNPDHPWPHLSTLKMQIGEVGKNLVARANIYPEFIDRPGFVHEKVLPFVKEVVNSEGYLKLDPTQGSSGEKEILDLTKVEYVEAKVRDRNLPVKHR
jgi:FO synthase